MMQLEVGVAQYHVITTSCDQQELSKSFSHSQPEVTIDHNDVIMTSFRIFVDNNVSNNRSLKPSSEK